MIEPKIPGCFEGPTAPMTAHETALLRHREIVEQIRADRADPTRVVRPEARRPR